MIRGGVPTGVAHGLRGGPGPMLDMEAACIEDVHREYEQFLPKGLPTAGSPLRPTIYPIPPSH